MITATTEAPPARPVAPTAAASLPIAQIALVVASTAFAAAAFHRGFSWSALALPLTCATVLPALISVACFARWRRPPLCACAVISLAFWFIADAVVDFRPDLRASSPWTVFSATARGTLDGWAQLLNVTLPAAASPTLLAAPFALTWLAAMAGVEVTLRTKAVIAPALPSLVLFAAAVAVTLPGDGSETLLTAGLAALTLLLALTRSSDRARPAQLPGSIRRGVWPVLLTAAVAAAATGAVSAIPGLSSRASVDPRDFRPVHLAAQPQDDLLEQLPAWRADPNVPLFTVSAPSPGYLRLAVLDHFDGRTWSSSARFTSVGGAIPLPSGGGAGRTSVLQQIDIQHLTGFYLPEAGPPIRAAGSELAVDLRSGTLISTTGLLPGRQYTLDTVSAPSYSTTQLDRLEPNGDRTAADDSDTADGLLPGVLQLAKLVRTAPVPAHNPYAQLSYLQAYMSASYGVDTTAPGATAAAQLDAVLAHAQPASVGQLAAIFTLTARALGYPSRIAVGFSPGARVAGTNTYQVNSGDAVAWSEVDFAGAGWLPFRFTTGSHPASSSTPTSISPTKNPVTSSAPASAEPSEPAGMSAPPGGHGGLTTAIWLAPASAALCYLAAVLAMPTVLRYRRRTRGSATDQILAAWHDMIGSAAAAGIRIAPSTTNTGIAHLAVDGMRLRAETAKQLFALSKHIDRVLFGAHKVTRPEARTAWALARRFRIAAYRSASYPRRPLMLLSPRRLRPNAGWRRARHR